jgi:hypothetical protein
MIQLTDEELSELADLIHIAWGKYRYTFGQDPHGTKKQIAAMLCFLPKDGKTYLGLIAQKESD